MQDCKLIVMMFALSLMITMLVGSTEGKYIQHRHKNILEMSLEENSENNEGQFDRKVQRGHHQKTRIHDDIITKGNYFQTWKVLQNETPLEKNNGRQFNRKHHKMHHQKTEKLDYISARGKTLQTLQLLQNNLGESSNHKKCPHHSTRRIRRPVARSKKIRISPRFGNVENEDDDELRPIWGTSNTATTTNILPSSQKRRLARREHKRILSTTTLKPSDISFVLDDTEESRPIWGFDTPVVPTRQPQIHSTTIHVKPDANIFHFKDEDEPLPVWGWGGTDDVPKRKTDTIQVIPTRLPRPKFTTILPPLVH